jgi:hypothetical protein
MQKTPKLRRILPEEIAVAEGFPEKVNTSLIIYQH